MKPIIGIVGHTDVNRLNMPATSIALAYSASIEKAAGVPLILPFAEDHGVLAAMADHVHGFLFPGGMDIDPEFYNDTAIEELGQVNKPLDLFQMAMLDLAVAQKKPVLGICRGIQLVTVALGGTLFQDIAAQFGTPALMHMQDSGDVEHPADIVPGSRLYELFGPRITVNSRHHQSVKDPGRDLIVTARAPDGVIEAAQHKHLPMDLVQWHPERMMHKSDHMLPLFKAFVERCRVR